MMLSKTSMILLMVSMFSMMFMTSTKSDILLVSSFLDLFKMNLKNFDLSIILSHSSMMFMLMTSTVTFFVAFFSQLYLEWYENKKYTMLMFMFYLSMIILSLSASTMTLVLGWDYLGVTSVFLIMFYPNENNMNNSIWTMMFNRLGDIFIMLMFCFIMKSSNSLYFFLTDPLALIFAIFCSMTKSAQFPFSTWLPLAMSAPTPISAMVHSSTLVTAGIFMVEKLLSQIMSNNLSEVIMLISIISMIIGGLMSCFENDLKKMIAFSTMSQISMILLMLISGMKMLSLMHMLFHAFFKSLLFSCSGMMFFQVYMDQMKVKLSCKNYSDMNNAMIMMSIFSMTGLTMSLSFFTKDYFMEWFLSNLGSYETNLAFLLSSGLTLTYCNGITMSSLTKYISNKFIYTKKMSVMFFVQALLMMSMFSLSKFMVNISLTSMTDLKMMNLFFMLIMLINLNKFTSNKMLMSLICMKVMYFSLAMTCVAYIYKKYSNNFYSSDKSFFKSLYIKLISENDYMHLDKHLMAFFLFLMWLMLIH